MYIVADTLVRIKNAQMAKKDRLFMPFSKMRWSLLKILKDRGFISDFEKRKKKGPKSEQNILEIKLPSSSKEQVSGISGMILVSKPSRRIYIKSKDIEPVLSGYGLAILSTPQGIITGEEARKNKVGGELLAKVW